MNKKHLVTIEYSAAQLLYWSNYCVYMGYAAVYLKALGYSNTGLGIIVALGQILSFSLGLLISSLIDRYSTLRSGDAITVLLVLQMVMTIAVKFSNGSGGLMLSAVYVLLLGFSAAVSAQLIKQWSDLIHSGHTVGFGAARSCGSAGYVVLSAALGVAVERTSVAVLPVTGFAITLLQLAVNLLLNAKTDARLSPKELSSGGSSLPAFLSENRSFTLLMGGLILVFSAHNIFNRFLINVINSLGGNTADMGYLDSFAAVVEIPAMIAYNRICRNRKLVRVLGFSIIMFFVKATLYAFSSSLIALYLSTIFQAFSFAIYTPAIVDYVGVAIPAKDSAKGQTIALGTSTLGAMIAAVIGGALFDSLSVRGTLFVAAAISFAGVVVCMFALGRKKTVIESR